MIVEIKSGVCVPQWPLTRVPKIPLSFWALDSAIAMLRCLLCVDGTVGSLRWDKGVKVRRTCLARRMFQKWWSFYCTPMTLC